MVDGAQIVVGFDGSPASASAVEWASAEAAQRFLPLRVVVAADYPGMPTPPRRGSWTPALLEASAEGHLEGGLRLAAKRLPEPPTAGNYAHAVG